MNKLCILTHGRTGSTLLVNLLQNTKQVLALSEIDQANYTTNHYDVIDSKGTLYNYKNNLKALSELTYEEYIDQFLNIASPSDTFVFKIVIKANYIEVKNKIAILEKMRFKFLILTRNFLDIFISNKKAGLTNRYANFDYSATQIAFSFSELQSFAGYIQSELIWMIQNLPQNTIISSYEQLFWDDHPKQQLKNIIYLLNRIFDTQDYNGLTLKDLEDINKKQNNSIKDPIYYY